MAEQFPRSKVATYHVWPTGEARFAACKAVAWRMNCDKLGNGTLEVGQEVEVSNDCGTFAAKFAGVFTKEGVECLVVMVEETPPAYYVLGAWSDAGDGNFPPVFAIRPDGQVLNSNRFQPSNTGFFPGALIATPTGERQVEDLAKGDLVLAWDPKPVPQVHSGHPVPDGKQTVRVKRVGQQIVSSRFRTVDRLVPVRIATGSLGSGMPHSDLIVTADQTVFADGTLREAGTLINGKTVTRVSLSEFDECSAVYQVETEAGAIILANGVPAETFVDNGTYRIFDGMAEFGEVRGGPPEMTELSITRTSSVRRLASRIKTRLGLGAKEDTAA